MDIAREDGPFKRGVHLGGINQINHRNLYPKRFPQ
jgi:hypothetical protein